MCGRYVVFNIPKHTEGYGIDPDTLSDFTNNYNASPGQYLPVITLSERYRMSLMKWGLIPRWAKDPKIGYKLINARSETVQEKPSYKKSFESSRCVIPANGFYEWQQQEGSDKKIPYYFKNREDNALALAGLHSMWMNVEGKKFDTFTILTKCTFEDARMIHPRIPVLVDRTDVKMWLDKETPVEKLTELLNVDKSEELEYYRVSSDVGNPRNNSEELIKPNDGKEEDVTEVEERVEQIPLGF